MSQKISSSLSYFIVENTLFILFLLKVTYVLIVRFLRKYGAPGAIRTRDLCLRRATLYPAELRVQINQVS